MTNLPFAFAVVLFFMAWRAGGGDASTHLVVFVFVCFRFFLYVFQLVFSLCEYVPVSLSMSAFVFAFCVPYLYHYSFCLFLVFLVCSPDRSPRPLLVSLLLLLCLSVCLRIAPYLCIRFCMLFSCPSPSLCICPWSRAIRYAYACACGIMLQKTCAGAWCMMQRLA